MPDPTLAASVQPSPHDRHTNRPHRRHFRPLLLLAGIALLFPAAAMTAPEASAAGRSCTGWTSTVVPPKTIRVGRAGGRGRVETVSFRHYVGIVMAREWPHYLPRAAMEAGAVAVKQYAWFHAMAGNHRRSFRSASGACFDVVDSTRDQLYEPEEVGIHPRIRQAVNATWPLSVHRNGGLFMTGYRAGNNRRCGADADGWRLFARSVIACARQGLSRAQIQQRYYGPSARIVGAGQAQAGAAASSSSDSAGSAAVASEAQAKARDQARDRAGDRARDRAQRPDAAKSRPPTAASNVAAPDAQPAAQRNPWLPYKV